MPKESPGKNTRLSVSVTGEINAERLENLYATIVQSGCNIDSGRMLDMGDISGTMLLLSGNWDNLVRCEDMLQRYARESAVNIHTARTGDREEKNYTMSYAIDLIAPNNNGIVHNIMKFINQNNMVVCDISISSYPVRESDTSIFTMRAVVRVPDSMAIGSFRADFSDLCDHLNLDAVIEPIKPYE